MSTFDIWLTQVKAGVAVFVLWVLTIIYLAALILLAALAMCAYDAISPYDLFANADPFLKEWVFPIFHKAVLAFLLWEFLRNLRTASWRATEAKKREAAASLKEGE